MKKRLSKMLTIGLALSLLLAGCSEKNNSQVQTSGGSNESSGKPVEITLWTGTAFKNVENYGANYGDWEKAKADEFNKLHPNVTVNVEVIPWKDIEQKVNVAVAGGNPPDILFDNVPLRIIRHAKNGQLEPLDEIVQDDKADWKQAYLNKGMLNDKLYTLTVYSYPGLMFVNKGLFDQKGLTHLLPQDRKWTWEQWEDAMKQVADKNVYGTAFFAKSEQQDQLMQSFIMSGGAEWANNDFSEYKLNSPEGVEALEFMLKLSSEGLVAPGTATMESNDTIELFKQGKLATMYQMPAVYDIIESGKKDGSVEPSVEPYGILPVYKEGVTPKLVVTSENGYALFKQKDVEKKKAALEFIKFLTNSENISDISKNVLAEPARISSEYEVENKDYAAIKTELSKLEVINLGRDVTWYSKLRQSFYPEIQAAFLGAKTSKEALDSFVNNANRLVSLSGK